MASLKWTGLAALVAIMAFAADAYADDPASDFKTNCSACHTIGGGPLQGPDLKDVETRQERAWLVRFINDPGGVIDSGDPYAKKMFERAKGVRMPAIAGMSNARAELLLDLVKDESARIDAGGKARFVAVTIPTRPFTKEEVELGRSLFTGETDLAQCGAACIACHTVGGIGGLGGGELGPDLTKVFERYEDRAKLGAWLTSPATPTMLPTFKGKTMDVDTEILPLVAYFEDAARTQQEEESIGGLVFLGLGVGGALVLLVLAGRAWGYRLRGVRKPLVERASWKGRADAASAANDG